MWDIISDPLQKYKQFFIYILSAKLDADSCILERWSLVQTSGTLDCKVSKIQVTICGILSSKACIHDEIDFLIFDCVKHSSHLSIFWSLIWEFLLAESVEGTCFSHCSGKTRGLFNLLFETAAIKLLGLLNRIVVKEQNTGICRMHFSLIWIHIYIILYDNNI